MFPATRPMDHGDGMPGLGWGPQMETPMIDTEFQPKINPQFTGRAPILHVIYHYFGGNTHKSINPKLTLRACARVVTSLSGSRGQVLMRHKIFVANAVHDWTSAHDEWLQKQAGAPWMFLVSGF